MYLRKETEVTRLWQEYVSENGTYQYFDIMIYNKTLELKHY